jgi:ATP-dependent helicase/nuclease subunit A
MPKRLKLLSRLLGDQERASDPRALVWLSASAGTGKTHVLSARVLRLLLNGVRPETILCLTFTKAGAAEMADRIHARLAYWVRLPDPTLAKELFALGEPHDAAAVARARTLFARLLDAPGAGLRIQTIHAFCQTLLAGFPAEAGITPGFRPLEGREEALLARRTLADLLTESEARGDPGLVRDVAVLSRRLGEGKAETYLMRCARAPDAMAALGPGIEAKVRHALDVPLGDVEEVIVAACADAELDLAALRRVAALNAAWGGKKGLERADAVAAWLAMAPPARAAALDRLHLVWGKAGGELRSFARGQAPADPDYEALATRCHAWCAAMIGLRQRAALAALLAAGLRAGQAFARAYAEAKRTAGVLDFDDLIRHAVRLLEAEGVADWVRYKLDQGTDHILVDEAQDTNSRQWAIVAALAEEFFAGEGARGTAHRTLFSVGDFKQAIFGFQGTDPIAFEAAGRIFAARAEAASREMLGLSLDRSFRSTPPILTVVDRLLADLGHETLNMPAAAPPHVSATRHGFGEVLLWRPVSAGKEDDSEDGDGEEGWIDDATRALAGRLARQIRLWLDDPFPVVGKGRPLKPEDIMILVRKRGELASLLVARLHAEGVPVAGVDRLRLTAPLAVRDLLAAIRFVLQPGDDLNLASLLVSPLFGLTQDRLYALGFDRKASLWRAVRDAPDCAGLAELLAMADFTTPYQFLETILSGSLDGRRRLIRRLGQEARDPIEELLNQALAFESDQTPSLQRFLDWFDRGEVDVTRDPSAPLDAVRVMTVHGSKGLQAPVVILADATGDPTSARADTIDWTMTEGAEGLAVPILRPRKEEMADSIAADLAAAEQRERAEHWRLLYVAATRAEERLVIAGALGPKCRGEPPAESWYQVLDRVLAGLGADWEEDSLWSGARRYRGADAALPTRTPRPPFVHNDESPAWLRAPAPRETKPPRPLAPSSLGTDDVADPPPSAGMLAAAERGRLLHALFERLPPIPPADRTARALRWLERSAGVADAEVRSALVRDACAIIDDPAHAALFAPDALAEAPIAAVVAGEVVAGTVDRLLVTDDRVRVIDFKTGRRVPADAASAPEHHVRQMAAYVAALEAIFPGRAVTATLLYTAGPKLIDLPDVLLARWKDSLTAAQQKLPIPH